MVEPPEGLRRVSEARVPGAKVSECPVMPGTAPQKEETSALRVTVPPVTQSPAAPPGGPGRSCLHLAGGEGRVGCPLWGGFASEHFSLRTGAEMKGEEDLFKHLRPTPTVRSTFPITTRPYTQASTNTRLKPEVHKQHLPLSQMAFSDMFSSVL